MTTTTPSTVEVRPSSSSSLEPIETSEHPLLRDNNVQELAHAKCRKARRRIIHAFRGSPDENLQRRASKISQCCCDPVIYRSTDGLPVLSLCRCRDRLCPLCATIRGAQAAAKVERIAATMNSPRLITLTLAATSLPLGDQVDTLFNAFKQLRRTTLWSRNVTGGVFTLEVTRNEKTGRWHPHIHILAEGRYLPHSQLRDEWHRITTDSFIVDIRAVHNRKVAARYIASYVAKPADPKNWTDDVLCEFAAEIKGRRLIGTFGKCHRTAIDGSEQNRLPKIHSMLLTASKIRHLEAARNPNVIEAVSILQRVSWSWSVALGRPFARSLAENFPISIEDQKRACQLLSLAVGGRPDQETRIAGRNPIESEETVLFAVQGGVSMKPTG